MYTINKEESEITIELSNANKSTLFALEDCKTGNCACKTSEYEKIQKIEITNEESKTIIKLTPKENSEIDTTEIEHCMDYITSINTCCRSSSDSLESCCSANKVDAESCC